MSGTSYVEGVTRDRWSTANTFAQFAYRHHLECVTGADDGEGSGFVDGVDVPVSRDGRRGGLTTGAQPRPVEQTFATLRLEHSPQSAVPETMEAPPIE